MMQPPHASINGTFLLDFAYCVYDMKCLIEYYYACRIILHRKYYSLQCIQFRKDTIYPEFIRGKISSLASVLPDMFIANLFHIRLYALVQKLITMSQNTEEKSSLGFYMITSID